MKLVPTEHIPGRCAKHDLQKLIEEFINGEAKVVNVDFNEHDYSSSKSCAGCFHNAIKGVRSTAWCLITASILSLGVIVSMDSSSHNCFVLHNILGLLCVSCLYYTIVSIRSIVL